MVERVLLGHVSTALFVVDRAGIEQGERVGPGAKDLPADQRGFICEKLERLTILFLRWGRPAS